MAPDPELIVKNFNACINKQDIQGLSRLMTEEHVFIDSEDEVHLGKETMIKGWIDFFNRFPDYRNHFTRLETRGSLVVIIGHSTCSYGPLDGTAIWTAQVEGDQVAEWRVYLDTEENREKLGLRRTYDG